MESEALLQEIAGYCRRVGMAESTFGRLAVNDGKLVSRLRFGGRVRGKTVERVRAFMTRQREVDGTARRLRAPMASEPAPVPMPLPTALQPAEPGATGAEPTDKNFRFYDNRQKYLLFVNTCSEKWVVADRVAMELANIHPHPPGLRIFDAGVGDGTVLTRVMRSMHERFPTVPFYIVGKEISLEDVRLTLEKMPDRFYEHPSTVLVLTNMYYSEAPWLTPNSVTAATSLVWHEQSLLGSTAHEFETQITELQTFLAQNWRAKVEQGDRQSDLREAGGAGALSRGLQIPARTRCGRAAARRAPITIWSSPRSPIAPARRSSSRRRRSWRRWRAAWRRAGRLIGIHSHGQDPGLEIIQKVWPGENPFMTDRHQSAARGQGRAGQRRARPQFQRLFRCALAVPLCDAHAAERDQRDASAPRPCSRRGMPRSTWRRSRTSGCPR